MLPTLENILVIILMIILIVIFSLSMILLFGGITILFVDKLKEHFKNKKE